MPDTSPASVRLAAWLNRYEIWQLVSEVLWVFSRFTIALYSITIVALLFAGLFELHNDLVSLHKQRSFHLLIVALLLEH